MYEIEQDPRGACDRPVSARGKAVHGLERMCTRTACRWDAWLNQHDLVQARVGLQSSKAG